MFKLRTKSATRGLQIGLAVSMVAAALVPAFTLHRADAAQVTSRNIKMSASALGTTGVDYQISFKAGQAMTVKGIVVEFCDDSPLPGVPCDIVDNSGTVVPTITTTNAANLFSNLTDSTGAGATSSIGTGTWTVSRANNNHTFKLTESTGIAIAPADLNPVMFHITANNPASSAGGSGHSFYARIYTYVDDTDVDGGDTGGANSPEAHTGGTTTGTYADYGGVALSTAEQISITTRVQETLNFCVNKTIAAIPGSCPGQNAPTLDIGHNGGSGPLVIDSTAVDTDTAVFGLSTNASSGATVRMRGDTLRSGSNTIDPVGDTAAAIVAGAANERFGLNVNPSADGDVTADLNYAGAGNYGFDQAITTAANGYGDRIAYTVGPIVHRDTTLTFAATAALTTPAGLYQTALDLIATGTY